AHGGGPGRRGGEGAAPRGRGGPPPPPPGRRDDRGAKRFFEPFYRRRVDHFLEDTFAGHLGALHHDVVGWPETLNRRHHHGHRHVAEFGQAARLERQPQRREQLPHTGLAHHRQVEREGEGQHALKL